MFKNAMPSKSDAVIHASHEGGGRGTFLQRLLWWKRQQAALLFSAWDIHDEGLVHVEHVHAIIMALFPAPKTVSAVGQRCRGRKLTPSKSALGCTNDENSTCLAAIPHSHTSECQCATGTRVAAHHTSPATITTTSLAQSKAVAKKYSTCSVTSAFLRSCLDEESGGPLPRPPVTSMPCLHTNPAEGAGNHARHASSDRSSAAELCGAAATQSPSRLGRCSMCDNVHACLCGCENAYSATLTSLRKVKEAYRGATHRPWPVASFSANTASPLSSSLSVSSNADRIASYAGMREMSITLNELYDMMSYLFYRGASDVGGVSELSTLCSGTNRTSSGQADAGSLLFGEEHMTEEILRKPAIHELVSSFSSRRQSMVDQVARSEESRRRHTCQSRDGCAKEDDTSESNGDYLHSQGEGEGWGGVSVWCGFELMRGSIYEAFDVCAGLGEGQVNGQHEANSRADGTSDTHIAACSATNHDSVGVSRGEMDWPADEPVIALDMDTLSRVGCHLLGHPMTRHATRALIRFVRQRSATVPVQRGVCCHQKSRPAPLKSHDAISHARRSSTTVSRNEAHDLRVNREQLTPIGDGPQCLTRDHFIHILIEC